MLVYSSGASLALVAFPTGNSRRGAIRFALVLFVGPNFPRSGSYAWFRIQYYNQLQSFLESFFESWNVTVTQEVGDHRAVSADHLHPGGSERRAKCCRGAYDPAWIASRALGFIEILVPNSWKFAAYVFSPQPCVHTWGSYGTGQGLVWIQGHSIKVPRSSVFDESLARNLVLETILLKVYFYRRAVLVS